MTNESSLNSACPLCGGKKEAGFTTFTVDLDSSVVVVRKVKATLCSQCGEEWISPEAALEIEAIVEKARREKPQFEVVELQTETVP